ncbi:MAG: hypothetical protein R3E67_07715 [Pseudomonadales bacterium]
MHALIIEHVKVSDLPASWRAQLHAANNAHVTIRIEEENTDSVKNAVTNPLFGMWSDREDMADVEGYMHNIRAPRF